MSIDVDELEATWLCPCKPCGCCPCCSVNRWQRQRARNPRGPDMEDREDKVRSRLEELGIELSQWLRTMRTKWIHFPSRLRPSMCRTRRRGHAIAADKVHRRAYYHPGNVTGALT
jgi:hypothetical protein